MTYCIFYQKLALNSSSSFKYFLYASDFKISSTNIELKKFLISAFLVKDSTIDKKISYNILLSLNLISLGNISK